jgi:mannose-6-phosphate isomerase-like protein (cupin superfamily)
MQPKIVKATSPIEFLTPERCFIMENWGASTGDSTVSIARARVEPGVTTKTHHLVGTQEIYLVTSGRGRVEVGSLAPAEVAQGDVVVIPAGTPQRITNIGESELVFYCVCTPAFTEKCYCNDEAEEAPK